MDNDCAKEHEDADGHVCSLAAPAKHLSNSVEHTSWNVFGQKLVHLHQQQCERQCWGQLPGHVIVEQQISEAARCCSLGPSLRAANAVDFVHKRSLVLSW